MRDRYLRTIRPRRPMPIARGTSSPSCLSFVHVLAASRSSIPVPRSPPANGHRDSKVSPMHTNTPCFSETQGSQCSSCQVRRRAERLEYPLNFNKQPTELCFSPENQSVGRKSKQTRESDCTCLVWRSVNGATHNLDQISNKRKG